MKKNRLTNSQIQIDMSSRIAFNRVNQSEFICDLGIPRIHINRRVNFWKLSSLQLSVKKSQVNPGSIPKTRKQGRIGYFNVISVIRHHCVDGCCLDASTLRCRKQTNRFNECVIQGI